MKIALYIEDGLEQIVLTPESETEDGILGKLSDGSRKLSIHRGEFYGCRGGWTRWKDVARTTFGMAQNDQSTIIVLAKPTGTVEVEAAATEVERLRTQVETISGYLRPLNELVVASEDDYCSDDTEKGEWAEPDDEPVAAGAHHSSCITFGTVRRARHSIDMLFALTSGEV